jgi:hydroxymethylpyrimidine/phosphomethylpyrimidine kinase
VPTGSGTVPVALTIASSDSGGGAGVQADLKAFARCGVHGVSAIVALPPEFVTAQLAALFADLPPQAVKTGMLFSAPIIRAVAAGLAGRELPFVLDPVLIASSGARLLREDAVTALVESLFPLASVVTPNLIEAQVLTGLDTEDRPRLAEALVALGARAALVTGGHGQLPVDHLFTGEQHLPIAVRRYPVPATHGAGCTHSAALAACLARGATLAVAARQAAMVAGAAVSAGLSELGSGDGPVDVLEIRDRRPPTGQDAA